MPMGAVIEMSSSQMPLNHPRPVRSPRRLVRSATFALVGLTLALAVFASSAFAVVSKVGSGTFGITPRSVELYYPGGEGGADFSNPKGNPVVHSSNVYVIYWDPTRYDYHGVWQAVINGFLHNVGAESGSLPNVFAVDSQYVDKANSRHKYSITYRGSYTDTDAYPKPGCTEPAPFIAEPSITSTCLTDTQIQQELKGFISQHELQTGMNAIFYVLTPPGVTVCLDGGGPTGHCSNYEDSSEESYENSFCSYHGDINSSGAPEGDASTVLYAVVPWIAGALGDG